MYVNNRLLILLIYRQINTPEKFLYIVSIQKSLKNCKFQTLLNEFTVDDFILYFCIFLLLFFNLLFIYLWSHMMLYVVAEIIIKTLKFAMIELPQDLKCIEKMLVVTDTDEKLLQGIIEIT